VIAAAARDRPITKKGETMTRERMIRLIAGCFILISVTLGLTVNQWWFAFTLFVGANLAQSALTGWCLMDDILRKVGVPQAS
jgi:hypothetical protein